MMMIPPGPTQTLDSDPVETREWTEAQAAVAAHSGSDRAGLLLRQLEEVARRNGVVASGQPYSSCRNTIPVAQQGACACRSARGWREHQPRHGDRGFVGPAEAPPHL